MFTPQQIEQISFKRKPIAGYDVHEVDALLVPLTQDYITLYKENALLKSKMKVLVNKLEEYRQNEASIKEAMVNAQKDCDLMIKDAEAKCAQMLNEAAAAAAEATKNAEATVAAEEARMENAKQLTYNKISEIQDQLSFCLDNLEKIKTGNRPDRTNKVSGAFDYDRANPEVDKTDAFVDEIAANLEALVGTTDECVPAVEPKHPVMDTTTSKFANLQFGRNYDPTSK